MGLVGVAIEATEDFVDHPSEAMRIAAVSPLGI